MLASHQVCRVLAAGLLGALCLHLASCSGSGTSGLVTGLTKARADACGTAHSAFPPWSADVTVCLADDKNGGSVSVDSKGTMTLTRGAEPQVAPKLVVPTAQPPTGVP